MAIRCPNCGAEYDVTLFTFNRRLRCDCGAWVDLAVGHQRTSEVAKQAPQEMMKETVLVTEPEFRKAEPVFRDARGVHCAAAPPDELALAETVTVRGVRFVIVGVVAYRGPLYEALGKQAGALIVRFGVGHDSIDKDLARRHRIVVANTPGVLDTSVAEHTLWLLGGLARHIARLDARVRTGEFGGETGTELCGKTLGILGLGNIGRRVAAMAHFGFGMRVIACDQTAAPDDLAALGVQWYTTEPEKVFRQAEFLSIHLPAHPSTERFLNATRLGWLSPGAMLVNTARGTVLDEEALFDALAAGQLAGAALDVFQHEPYEPIRVDKDLRRLENVLLTPHVGSNTREANARMAAASLQNVRCFLAGDLERMSRVDLSCATGE